MFNVFVLPQQMEFDLTGFLPLAATIRLLTGKKDMTALCMNLFCFALA
jgi:hypothetical protein